MSGIQITCMSDRPVINGVMGGNTDGTEMVSLLVNAWHATWHAYLIYVKS